MTGAFDPTAYWRHRLEAAPDLTGTGTSGLPLAWQHTLYRAKRRATLRLLDRNGVDVRGRTVLDVGCGTGWFEDLWEEQGAAHVAGVDIVASVVQALAVAHPHRTYVTADLTCEPLDRRLAGADLVTLMDVAYHLVEDAAVRRLLARVTSPGTSGDLLLFTDDLRGGSPAPHVRFRPRAWWEDVLDELGYAIVDAAPMYVLHNRHGPGDRRWPGAAGHTRLILDRVALRLVPGAANMHVVLARRQRGEGTSSARVPRS